MGSDKGLSWVVHPLTQESPHKSAALVACIAAFALLAAASLDGALYGVISLVVLTLSTIRYFLPTRYRVDSAGVAWRLLVEHHRPWHQFARVEERPDGLFLSPFTHPTRLDAYRGLHLRFSPHVDGAAVAALVRSRVRPQASPHVAT
jgi:hypothetical protein